MGSLTDCLAHQAGSQGGLRAGPQQKKGGAARLRRPLLYLHQTPIAVLAVPGRDALGHDGAARVLADVDHLRPGVGLI
mgnify:CR=1 FL=1